MSETVVAWLFAGAGWAVALLLILVLLLARRDWSKLWQNAWELRQQGWAPDPLLRGAAPGDAPHLQRRPGLLDEHHTDDRSAEGPTEPIELSAEVTSLIMKESEAWRREELAEVARDLYRGGATDLRVVAEIRRQLSDRQ